MKKALFFTTIIFLGLAYSCTKEAEVIPDQMVMGTLAGNPNTLFASAVLNGANEVPTNTSTATGTADGVYNKSTKILDLNVTYKDLTPTNWHIHKGATGVAGGVVFALGTNFVSPLAYKSVAFTDAQETDLLAGSHYVNIHSATRPAGEIRGNLTVEASKATGSVEGTFNPTTKVMTIKINYANITPVAWHIHKGSATESGPVVFNLGSTFSSGFTYTSVALTTEQEADLKAGNLYVNMHTGRAPNGEIRGQIAAH
jgi:CHRD domain